MSAIVVSEVLDLAKIIVFSLARAFFAASRTDHFASALTCTYLRFRGDLYNKAGAASFFDMSSFKHKAKTVLSAKLLNQATNALRHVSRKRFICRLGGFFAFLRRRERVKTNRRMSTKL